MMQMQEFFFVFAGILVCAVFFTIIKFLSRRRPPQRRHDIQGRNEGQQQGYAEIMSDEETIEGRTAPWCLAISSTTGHFHSSLQQAQLVGIGIQIPVPRCATKSEGATLPEESWMQQGAQETNCYAPSRLVVGTSRSFMQHFQLGP